MRISVVVPVYNEERFVGPCLDAVLAQAEPVHEVIVVDNNSADRTEEVVTTYGKSVTLKRESRQGVQHARAAGFDAAGGDVIGRIDADTRLAPDWSRRVRETFADPAVRAATGPVSYYDVRMTGLIDRGDAIFRWVWSRGPIDWLLGANMALRKQAWQTVKPGLCTGPDVHEDIDLAVHLHGAGERIVFAPRMRAATSGRRAANRFGDFRRYLLLTEATYARHRELASPGALARAWLTTRVQLGLFPYLRLMYALGQPDPWTTFRRDRGRKNPMLPTR
jgi:glycosyltransferase involved in cell wall biosynthesis